MIKNVLYKSFLGQLLISYYHVIKCRILPVLLSDENAVKRYYKRVSGKDLPLSEPLLFSEKLNWYKLNDRKQIMQDCADKYSVRDYVTKCGYGHTLNELYGVYDNVNEISIEYLPNKFVLKAAHGSHMNIIWPSSKYTWWQAKMLMNSWLLQDIYWSGREWVYKDMPKRIIAEKYLEDETGELKDYKFFCFNGIPQFIQYNSGRFSDLKIQNFYDMDWNILSFGKGIPHNPDVVVKKPEKLKQMVEMATDLCKPFQFVRVDLYDVNNNVVFGELTFFPAGGAPDFIPECYDKIVGDMWVIND